MGLRRGGQRPASQKPQSLWAQQIRQSPGAKLPRTGELCKVRLPNSCCCSSSPFPPQPPGQQVNDSLLRNNSQGKPRPQSCTSASMTLAPGKMVAPQSQAPPSIKGWGGPWWLSPPGSLPHPH